jgi:hypothetical protein
MGVKSAGNRYSQTIHHNAADAIGEAPILVAIPGKGIPGAFDIDWRDIFKLAD